MKKRPLKEGDYPHMETDPGSPFEDEMFDAQEEEESIQVRNLREYVRRYLRTIL